MKTAIYIEDGVVQLVLTPENEFEKNAISSFSDKQLNAKIFNGSFYDCRGGWVRQNYLRKPSFSPYGYSNSNDRSIIIRVVPKVESSD